MTTGSRARPSGGRRPGGGGFTRRRRGRNALKAEEIDYKDVQLMRRFVNERGKIVSGQRIGVSAKNQRRLARAIKRAQHLALIPMAPTHIYVTGAVQTETQRPQETESTEEQEPQARADAPQADAQQPEASDQQTEVVSQTEEETVENDDASDQDTDAESDEKE